jgi:hypothetical protein
VIRIALALAVATVTAAPTITTVIQVGHPRGIVFDESGGFIVAEPFRHVVEQVSSKGVAQVIAGTGTAGYSGDGGQATQAQLDQPHGVAIILGSGGGAILIADALNHRIRMILPGGTISTVAGNGTAGFSGDGGQATDAEISSPRGVAALPNGTILIADTDNQRIRKVAPDGTITTIAGNGVRGFAGDGGFAEDAELNEPFGVAPLPDGGYLIDDTDNERIRRVGPDGTITTVAGNGVQGYGGDGGPATAAELDTPHAVVPTPDGGFLIADTYNNRVRRVTPNGVITTVAGTGTSGFSGDGGPATSAELNLPKALAVLPDGTGFLVGDSANDRVRLVTLDLRTPFHLTLVERRLTIRAGHPAVLHLTLTLPAAVRVDVGRLHIVVKRSAGRSVLVFGRTLKPGRYAVKVTATAADARTDSSVASLKVLR